MKQQLSLIIIIALVTLSACSPNEGPRKSGTTDATIQPADLSKYEETLLQAGGAKKTMAFDYNIKGTDIQYVHIWMDVYKKGKKERFMDLESLVNKTEKGHFLLTIQPTKLQDDDSQHQKLVTTLVSNNGYSQSTTVRRTKTINSGGSASMELSNETKIVPGNPITLAVKLQDPDARSFSLSRTQFETEQDIAQEAKKYERVSVLRCEFMKNEPLDIGSYQES